VAGAKVHWGGQRFSYIVDLVEKRIYGNMAALSAEEPYVCIYAGRDVSDEVNVSPVDVGAIAFEDEHENVRLFVCNLEDAARNVVIEFRGQVVRVSVAAGDLREVQLLGAADDRPARSAPFDAKKSVREPRRSLLHRA
jgi:hypothetical protein